jgi:hypothetical protein
MNLGRFGAIRSRMTNFTGAQDLRPRRVDQVGDQGKALVVCALVGAAGLTVDPAQTGLPLGR